MGQAGAQGVFTFPRTIRSLFAPGKEQLDNITVAYKEKLNLLLLGGGEVVIDVESFPDLLGGLAW